MKLIFRTSSIALMILMTVIISSCTKYEEGPKFTLLPASTRITGNWTTTALTINGQAQNLTGTTLKTEIKKDGTWTTTNSYFGSSFAITDNGTWKFNSDKTQVISVDSDGDETTFTIIMLKNKMLKWKIVDGNTTTIATLEQ
jgi:hypothetical protein